MTKKRLTPDSEFTVGEEKVLNYVMAFFFLALFLYGVTDAALRNFRKIDYQSYVFVLAILPFIYCLKRARSRRIYIRVNKKGIYLDEQLMTGWSGFIKAWLAQKPKKGLFEIKDNFLLVVEYRKDKTGVRRNIPLTNTQNRSEEDVLAAVNYFYNEFKKKQAASGDQFQ